MASNERPRPVFCATKRVLAEYLTIFVRDMALQNKKVRLIREGNTIFCQDPQRAWVFMDPSRIR